MTVALSAEPLLAALEDALARAPDGGRRLVSATVEIEGEVDPAAIAAGALDAAAAHVDLAESYIATGDKAQAKKEAIAAMEVAPGYPRAQDLLLKLLP